MNQEPATTAGGGTLRNHRFAPLTLDRPNGQTTTDWCGHLDDPAPDDEVPIVCGQLADADVHRETAPATRRMKSFWLGSNRTKTTDANGNVTYVPTEGTEVVGYVHKCSGYNRAELPSGNGTSVPSTKKAEEVIALWCKLAA